MLINLPNHPSARWSEAQKKAAIELYGTIEENIGSDLSSQEVLDLAKAYLVKVKAISPKATVKDWKMIRIPYEIRSGGGF